MKLLVLGGTVYLSKTVAALGVSRGHDVTVAARGVSGEPPDRVRFVKVNRNSAQGVAALDGAVFDAVVDVARVPMHVGYALDALAGNAGHWTLVSSCSVYSDQRTPGQTAENAPLQQPTSQDSSDSDMRLYGRNKVACEGLVRQRVGDRAFTIRAGLIIGPGDPNDRFGYWPFRIAEGGEILAPGTPDDDIQFIDVSDLATWIVDAAENGITGTYDGACQPIPRHRFLAEIAEAMGTRPTFTWVPQDFLLEHDVNPWAGDDSLGLWVPLPEHGGFLSRDTSSSAKAGMKTRAIGDTARYYRSATGEEPPKLLANLPRSKEAAVLAAWHERQTGG